MNKMAFEIYEKGRFTLPSLEDDVVSIRKTAITFAKNSVNEFAGVDYVEVYLDRKSNQVGFRGTENKITGFRLQRTSKCGTCNITGKFLKLLPHGIFKMKVEDGFVVINVPEIIDNTKTVKVNLK